MFAGRVPHAEIQRYYSIVDVFAYPRQSMRLTELVTPLKPLEAMAQGRLLVASDVGGHKELIRDGETGVLFRAGDAASLADAHRSAARPARPLAATARTGSPLRRTGSHLGRERGAAIAQYSTQSASPRVTLAGLRIGLVGPLPPPAGGMANQTRQLAELLEREGANVTLVQTNASLSTAVHRARSRPARPVPSRALCRPPMAGRRSGGNPSRHGQFRLVVAPVRRAGDIGSRTGVASRSVVNYRGGEAGTFLARSGRIGSPHAATLRRR